MTCPICSAPSDAKFRPFCSKRCADLDLARWLGGRYAIPSDDPEDAQEALEELEKTQRSTPPKPH
jgi:endogenous inhibitor of DNA gyrase (YacG/DUF329 family)